ncbi:MAG: sigma-70 family RNA polymerase sigma factor [Anaerolineae bacterium]|nr:sigma-70 family RNA polymerase sigma factor [Anaerolineae bacterium]
MRYAVNLGKAVSDPDDPRRYCLLSAEEQQAYGCVETANKLASDDKDLRICAYWHHVKTHGDRYRRWAANHGYVDPTAAITDPKELSEEVVDQALARFRKAVDEGRYDVAKGLPCQYFKAIIKNFHQDLRKHTGRHPSSQECHACWEGNDGRCPHFGATAPWEGTYRKCYRFPMVASFEQTVLFAVAGLQNDWPPVLNSEAPAGMTLDRPVEEQALDSAMISCVQKLMVELPHDQHTVIIETFFNHRSSQKIAGMIGTSLENVYQLRHRALSTLLKALTGKL